MQITSTRTTSPVATRSRTTAALVALVALLAGLLGVASAAPVAAHSGGKAVVLVKNLTVAPQGEDWTATAVLVDFDSGDPVVGSAVRTTIAEKTTELTESGPGVYTGTLTGAPAEGDVTMGFQVRTRAGQEAVAAFDKQYSFTLVSGQATPVTSGQPTGEGGGGSNMPLILSVVAAVLVAALLYGLFAIRRRTSVPVRAR